MLDFRNETADIGTAFEPYYGRTVAPPTDPNLLFETRRRLDELDVLRPEEVEATVAVLLTGSDGKGHAQVYALLDPALERFLALAEDDQLAVKDVLDKFVRTYSFLSQIVSFGEAKLERDYLYCRALASRLRDAATVERLDLSAEVELTHLRNSVTFEGTLTLGSDVGEVQTIFGEGAGRQTDPPLEPLSQIVASLNERFGLDLDERDQLLFDQFEATWLADPDVAAQATIFKRILDDEEFRAALTDLYASRVYRRAWRDDKE